MCFAALPNLLSVGLLDFMKRRIDQLLVERGVAESRHKAQALLLAGQILVDEQKIEKPGQLVDLAAEIRVLRQLPFASRAGAKLQAALDHFGISVKGRVCADLGASTGGFTDCLLQNGASGVYAFDVGKGQLAWRLRSDSRVVVRDEFNVRNLRPGDLPDEVSVVTIDLSFISVTKILPALRESLASGHVFIKEECRPVSADIVVLVKPQFEVGKGEVGKGGIVRDPGKRSRALEGVKEFARQAGYQVLGSIPSPITGTQGNQEFLLYLQPAKGLLSSL
jgi:23S rRNA (cytidine1920-2'-O)/16S rRNA (cytidine1409-2'-O)-methyltransferase